MLEELLPSSASQWVLRNKKVLSLGAVALLFWVGWQGFFSGVQSETSLEEKLAAWKKHPKEEALYQGLLQNAKKLSGFHLIRAEIAQVLLSLGRADEAESFARPSIEELRKIAPAYAEFTDISLLISKKKYQAALERAVSLKEALKDTGSALYGKNLVRIAFLQQILVNRAGETAAWGEVEEWMKVQGPARRESDLLAYLEERKALDRNF